MYLQRFTRCLEFEKNETLGIEIAIYRYPGGQPPWAPAEESFKSAGRGRSRLRSAIANRLQSRLWQWPGCSHGAGAAGKDENSRAGGRTNRRQPGDKFQPEKHL